MKARAIGFSLWKDITRTIPMMLDTSMWTIGNGKSISAWEENSFGKDYCLNIQDITTPKYLYGDRVRDLMNKHDEWNMQILQDRATRAFD